MLGSDAFLSEVNTGTALETSFQALSDSTLSPLPSNTDYQSFRLLLCISALSFLIILVELHGPTDFLQVCEAELGYWVTGMCGVSSVSVCCGVLQYYLPKETLGQFCVLALLPVGVCGLEMLGAMMGMVLLHNNIETCNQSYWVLCLLVLLLSLTKLFCYCVFSLVVILHNCGQCLFCLSHLFSDSEARQCAYCEGRVEVEDSRSYPCRHSFHSYCLGIYVASSQCPICAPSFDA